MKTYPITTKSKPLLKRSLKLSKTFMIVFALFMVGAVIVSAAVIPWFGRLTATVTVEQPILIGDGHGTWMPYPEFIGPFEIPEAAPGGERRHRSRAERGCAVLRRGPLRGRGRR